MSGGPAAIGRLSLGAHRKKGGERSHSKGCHGARRLSVVQRNGMEIGGAEGWAARKCSGALRVQHGGARGEGDGPCADPETI